MTTHKILRLRCVKYFVLFDFMSFVNLVLLDFEACLINGQFVVIGIRPRLILIAYRFYLIGFYLPLSSFCRTGLAVFEHKWNILKTFIFYLNGELSNNRTHQTGGIVSRRKSNGDYKIARKYFWFERKGDKHEIKKMKVTIFSGKICEITCCVVCWLAIYCICCIYFSLKTYRESADIQQTSDCDWHRVTVPVDEMMSFDLDCSLQLFFVRECSPKIANLNADKYCAG